VRIGGVVSVGVKQNRARSSVSLRDGKIYGMHGKGDSRPKKRKRKLIEQKKGARTGGKAGSARKGGYRKRKARET